MKTYHGKNHGGLCTVTVDGKPLDPRHDLCNHSPDGFQCYHGSGPAQLALALASDFLGDDEAALRIYQRLKDTLVAGLPQGRDWTLDERTILTHVQIITSPNTAPSSSHLAWRDGDLEFH